MAVDKVKKYRLTRPYAQAGVKSFSERSAITKMDNTRSYIAQEFARRIGNKECVPKCSPWAWMVWWKHIRKSSRLWRTAFKKRCGTAAIFQLLTLGTDRPVLNSVSYNSLKGGRIMRLCFFYNSILRFYLNLTFI